jgi:hypothetical protein
MAFQDRLRREATATERLIDETGDLVRQHASRRGGNLPAVLASVLALMFSGVSLYQTVIKQAHLHLFVPDAIAYTRDPDGSYEVFAVPLTVANSGARDGIVSSLKLQVRNSGTGATQTLEAAFVAGPEYFSTKEDVSNNIRRPKAPFAPLSVAGRDSLSATVLFYARNYEEQRLVPGQGRYEVVLTAESRPTAALGVFDSLWSTEMAPQSFVYELPAVSRFFDGRMASGYAERMFRVK